MEVFKALAGCFVSCSRLSSESWWRCCVTVVVVIGEVSHVRLGFVAAPHVRLFIFFIFLPKTILLFCLFGVTKGISKGFNS